MTQQAPLPGARQSLREFVDFFGAHLDGPLIDEFRAAQREVILSRTVVLIWISLFVMPTAILSYVCFQARGSLVPATWIVLGAIALVLIHRELVTRHVFDRRPHLAMLLLVGGVFGPTGSAIVEITRGSQGDFFFAFFLIYFAFTSLFPADVKWVLTTSAAIIASYVGARLFRAEGFVLDAALTSNLIYFLELTFIGVVLNRVLCKLFFDEKRARIELAKANEGLRDLDRAKTSFFANISHEIRTPLTLILTPVSHMLQMQRERLDPDQAAKLDGVRNNANRLLNMVNSLLDFAKVEAGEAKIVLSDFAVDDVVKYVAGLFAGTAEDKGITLQIQSENAGLSIRSDLDKLEKMLVNLIGNALKFTPRGGTITVRGDRVGDRAEFTVTDTGMGIPLEHRDAIFQRFTQLENAHQASIRGTGIGLSMVREYTRLLGGTVTLESEVGKGSTFTILLPAKAEIDGPTSQNPPSNRDRTSDRELAVADLVALDRTLELREIETAGADQPRILVVDDNPALVGLVSSILESQYNLYLASNAKEALKRLATSEVDLVLSDVMMPGISGLELCKKIKANPRTAHIPVVLLTARGATAQKVEGLEQGADDYLGKPFDPEELKARIRSLFELRKVTRGLAQKSTELEASLRQLKEQELKVIASEKLRTLGELASGLLHELHNSLNMVCNGADPLKQGLAELDQWAKGKDLGDIDLPELTELCELVLASAKSARAVTGELKGFAEPGSGDDQLVDLNAAVRSTLRLLGTPGPAVSVVLELSADTLVVVGTSARLTQIFTNLVKNAFEATGSAGTVTIATRLEGGSAVVRVSDTGQGVPEAMRSRLFEPFATTKSEGEGLGLGLSLSLKAARELGGDLQLDPDHAPGARFVVTLPIARGSQPPAPPPSISAERPDLRASQP